MKTPFVTKDQLEAIAAQYPTRSTSMMSRASGRMPAACGKAFAWNPGYREYFAVKAAPTPAIAEAAARGGLRLRLFLHDGADDLGAVRHHR